MILKRTKIFITLAIIALVLVAIGLQMLTQPDLKYVFSKPATYAQCLDAGGMILESYPSQCSFRGQTFPNPNEKSGQLLQGNQSPDQPENETKPPQLKTYTDAKNGFSFQYDTNIFAESRVQEKLPWKNKSIDSFLLVHTVPVEHCDLSGLPDHCTPTTTDISLAFTPLEASLADIILSSKKTYGIFEDNWNFHGIPATVASLGAEGEGKQYTFISLAPEKTLMIVRSFIDEQIVSKYQNVEGYYSRDEQAMIFEQLMATFNLTK